MDSLLLRNLSLRTRIGVTKKERSKPQHLRVSVELFHPLAPVAAADNPSRGIDYDDVLATIRCAAKIERKTIERLAEDIAAALLREFRPTGGVTVTVSKRPYSSLDSASVVIHRPIVP